ncbi:unnamed protein product, partial [Closterium sp. Naga37s-1]
SSPAQRPYVAVLIVPTGVGAEIGGFAGDALPVARAFSSVAECLIAHPNVLNGAMLYWPLPRALYVEGHALDRFARGEWGLQPVHSNRVGLVFDRAIEEDLLQRHLQVADAARATLGIDIVGYTVTDRPLKVHKWVDGATGAATGRIDEADSLLRAVHTLLAAPLAAHPPSHAHALSPAAAPATGARGVDAVGVVARFPDDAEEVLQQYREGQGVDVLAGVEAVISHLVVHRFQLPAAHAPALAPLPLLPSIAPRSAAEEIGHTFLPCVLAGLSRAPRLVTRHAPPTTAAKRTGAGGGQEGQEGQEGAAIASSIPTIIGGAWDYSRDGGSSSSGTSTSMSSMGGGGGVVWAEDVDCVVLPVDAFGSPAAQALARRPGGPVSAARCHAVLHAAMLCCTLPCCAACCHAVLHAAMLCCTLPCCAARCHAVLHAAMLCCTLPCCAARCHAVLHSAMLCCTLPCCAALCHAVLHAAMLCCTLPCCAAVTALGSQQHASLHALALLHLAECSSLYLHSLRPSLPIPARACVRPWVAISRCS